MVYRGELTPAAKAVLQRDPDVGYQKLHDVVSDAADAIYDQLTHAADCGMISAVEAAAARNHIVNMILREAGNPRLPDEFRCSAARCQSGVAAVYRACRQECGTECIR